MNMAITTFFKINFYLSLLNTLKNGSFSLPVLSHLVLPDTKNQHLAIPKEPIFLPTITTVRNESVTLQL